MGRRLNRITDEVAQRLLARAQRNVARLAQPARERTPRHHETMAELCFQVGALGHRQGWDPDVIRPWLVRSAKASSLYYGMLGAPAAQEHRSPWAFLHAVSLVVGFGSQDMRQQLSAVSPEVFCAPRTMQHQAVVMAATCVCSMAAGTLDEGLVLKAAQQLEDAQTPLHARKTLAPLLSGLVAVSERDADGMQSALKRVVDDHAREAMHGEYQKLPEGLLSANGLLLVVLCRERGLASHLDSPYLPVELLPI